MRDILLLKLMTKPQEYPRVPRPSIPSCGGNATQSSVHRHDSLRPDLLEFGPILDLDNAVGKAHDGGRDKPFRSRPFSDARGEWSTLRNWKFEDLMTKNQVRGLEVLCGVSWMGAIPFHEKQPVSRRVNMWRRTDLTCRWQ
jgi:hypothetical protein